MQTWSFRPATEEDIPTILEIENRVHIAPWTAENIRAELAKPYARFLVLTDDETDSQISGYICYWSLLDEGQILNVAVDLPYRGLGFAKKMIQQAVRECSEKGLKKMSLDVRKTNLAAIHLYQGQRFDICQVRRRFYSNGEDAYQMVLALEDNVRSL